MTRASTRLQAHMRNGVGGWHCTAVGHTVPLLQCYAHPCRPRGRVGGDRKVGWRRQPERGVRLAGVWWRRPAVGLAAAEHEPTRRGVLPGC